ncbi:hypothetical protein GCM10010124_03940 [Pilimelia terevasa]|uniref:Uncharacterized protein n=1 Tax=Pilimelia terevasa TaxID=53372 RepID=A0A8J3BH56_9ACTN|nr:hypothetical protein [Pilimelia terevasa]GGK14606.1 hypothetical protein GCM10010124_03940 [Pilimelia terevasa]
MSSQSGRRRAGAVSTRLSLAVGAAALAVAAPAAAAAATPPVAGAGPAVKDPDLHHPELAEDRGLRGARAVLAAPARDLDCSDDGSWVFRLDGVGGRTGVRVPKFIVAKSLRGQPVAAVRADEWQGVYRLPGEAQLSGRAVTWVDPKWSAGGNRFALIAAPCEAPTLTAEAAPTVVSAGGTVVVSGQLTDKRGRPVARHAVALGTSCADRCRRGGRQDRRGDQDGGSDGKGGAAPGKSDGVDGVDGQDGARVAEASGKAGAGGRGRGGLDQRTRTDREGRFRFTVRARELGLHELTVRSAADAPEPGRRGLATAEKILHAWAIPGRAPVRAGELASAKGDALTAGPKATTVTGEGFRPGSEVAVLRYPADNKLVAAARADGRGRISVEVDLPAELRGDQVLVAFGEDRRCRARLLARRVTVQAPGLPGGGSGGGGGGTGGGGPTDPQPPTTPVSQVQQDDAGLPVTGGSLAGILVGGAVIVVGGALLRVLARRRRSADPLA